MRLALGTVQFGLPYGIANQTGQISREEAKAILSLARASHIDTLDTAIAYGDSEACLGEAGTTGFKVITKLPALPDAVDIGQWVSEQMRTSLERLGAPNVYGLLLHRSQQLAGPHGKSLVRALQALKDEGKVEKVGVSIYSPLELDAVMQVCSIDLIQAPFNLIDRRLYTSGWLARLHDSGVEVHARSAFLQGLLLMPRESIPAKFAPWQEIWNTWHHWLSDHSLSAAQVCLAFVQSFQQIDKVVVGVDSLEQLEQLIFASQSDLKADWPKVASDDENLINPSHWPTS